MTCQKSESPDGYHTRRAYDRGRSPRSERKHTMKFQDYIDETRENAIEVIEQGDYDYIIQDADDAEEAAEKIAEELWIDDGVTGNGSGSFTFNTAKAKENTAELVWDEDFIFELEDLAFGFEVFKKGAEAVDVIARCLALGHVHSDIEDAVEERFEELHKNDEDEEAA